ASFCGSTSEMNTVLAPPARAASAVMIPMVPAPTTAATSPGGISALGAAYMPTANGSIRAPSAKLRPWGGLEGYAAEGTTASTRQPGTGGVAKNRTPVSTL